MRQRPWLYVLLPMLMHSADALAWGLATHIYFSQLLIWAVPLLDPRFRAAAKRLPQLVLAGACLPDLALVGRHAEAEWAMDAHRARHVFASPPHLLGEHHATLAAYAETEFACTRAEAEKAL